MVTKSTSAVREVFNSGGWIAPSPSLVANVNGRREQARQSNPTGPHAINNMGMDDGSKFMEEVESDDDEEGFDGIASLSNENYNILIPQLSFQKLIGDNFCCKHCHRQFRDRSILVDKIGFASNVFWVCATKDCPSSASILAPTYQIEVLGKFQRRNVTTPAALGDYAINRQVALACQQSRGGARMASTFGKLLSMSYARLSF
jgi:hypothetical protein